MIIVLKDPFQVAVVVILDSVHLAFITHTRASVSLRFLP